MDLKRQLRLKFRNWLKENVTREVSLICGEALKEKLAVILGKIDKPKVSIFISKLPEISTASLIDHLYSIDAKIYIPAWNSGEMWMCHVENRREFEKIVNETPEGKIPMPTASIVPIADVVYDFIIVPGLVFDRNCHRLGYGYGHYDYFLSKYFEFVQDAHKTRLIGICYDEQISEDSLPFEDHDIQLHEVITPSCTVVNLQ